MVVIRAGGDVDRAERGGEAKVDFATIVSQNAGEGAHVAVVGVTQAHSGRTEVVRNSGSELQALERDAKVIHAKVRRQMVLVTCEGAELSIPVERGCASSVFTCAADQKDRAFSCGTNPILAVVKATPDVIGVITKGSGDSEVVILRSRSDRIFWGG